MNFFLSILGLTFSPAYFVPPIYGPAVPGEDAFFFFFTA